jgi:phosphomannomutase
MKNLFLFDVDGTITESGEKIQQNMIDLLNEIKYNPNNEIGIVGGGKLDKILYQFDSKIIFDHYFTECGCCYYKNSSKNQNLLNNIYCKNIRTHELFNEFNKLIKICLKYLSNVDYNLSGTFIDLRSGLIYVSLIGMQANNEERKYFINYDKHNKIREQLIIELNNHLISNNLQNKIVACEGGTVGIALYPSEWDKIQVLDKININYYKNIYYFGDKYLENGNDYKLINSNKVIGFKIDSLYDTIEYLNNLL